MSEGVKIDKDLNLVVTVERADGKEVHAHCVPLPMEIFKQYFLTISKAFAQIYMQGLTMVSGPRVAWMLLEKAGKETGEWEGLKAHLNRLCTVMAPDGKGSWGQTLLQDAVARRVIDEEDAMEVEGLVAFFICVCAMHRRAERKQFLDLALPLWGGQLTSSTVTAFQHSLPTSTGAASSGGRVASSVRR